MTEPPTHRVLEPGKRSIVIETEMIAVGREKKIGRGRGFTVFSDEIEAVGGENTAPSPLTYFCMALGF